MRRLTPREAAVLGYLLSADFPGVSQLRAQAGEAKVKRDHTESPNIEFEIEPSLPTAAVSSRVPVEARVNGSDPPVDILLFVENGVLDSLELVTHESGALTEFPSPQELAEPTVNPWTLGKSGS